MIFEAKNGKTFRGFPLNIYRFNLKVNESCYAIIMILDNGEEYILNHCNDVIECKKRCTFFNREYETKVHYIKVTRLSDNEFSYCLEDSRNNFKGNKSGTFKQNILDDKVDEFTIGASIYRPTHIEKSNKPKKETSLNDLYLSHISNIK